MKFLDASLGAVAVAAVASGGAQAYYLGSPQQPFISQKPLDGFNILKYLGGLGPYVDRESLGISRDPPAGCEVDQVHMIHRHGERYPEAKDGAKVEYTLEKLKKADLPRNGSLGFFKDWQYFVENKGDYGLETWSGPYSGLAGAYQRGAEYRERYGHLWDKQSKMPIFTAGFERIVQTARKFGEGFLHFNYSDSAAVNVILKHEENGANSLTPKCLGKDIEDSKACNATKFNVSMINPHFDWAAERLNEEYSGLDLNGTDIHNLQLMASFEMNLRSWTPWISAFSKEEWVGYEYLRDLSFYYCAGPGAEMAKAVGSVYANATLQLLKEGPENALPMYWSFMHDTNITPDLTAFGLTIPANPDLPWNGTIPFYNQYRCTDIVPMSAHFVLERMTCKKTSSHNNEGVYVRGILNEAVTPFPDCHDGPGFSCRLDKFESDVVMKHHESFTEKCSIPKEYPQYLDFFWNYNTTSEYNHAEETISYQKGEW